jgi:hypothetical protein
VAGLVGTDNLVLLAWGIGGVIALCGALAFAELGGMYHGPRRGLQRHQHREARDLRQGQP